MDNLEKYTGKRAMFQLSWPIFIELTLQMLVGNMDQFMVSRYSQNAVGAIGNANQILNVLLLTFSVISMATTILVSQYLGSGNYRLVGQTYAIAVVVNVIFGLLVSGVLVFLNGPIFRWMLVPQELMHDTQIYTATIGSCISFQAVFLTFSSFFRSNAWMRESMYVSVLINVLNIVGNALLIPKMGVAGAAVSSNISRLLGMLLIVFMFRRKSPIRLSFSDIRPFPTKQFKTLLGIGLPSGGESLSYNLTQIIIMGFANVLGTVAINTKVYASMFAMLSCLYASAVGQAQQIIVGYFIGAKKADMAYTQVYKTLRSAALVSLCISTLLFLCSPIILGFLTTDPKIIRLGRMILGIEIVLELGRSFNIVLVRALQGTGDIQFPIVVGIASQWVVAVGGSFLFSMVLGWGLAGIWIAMSADECLRGFIYLLRWKSGKWRVKSLLAE